MSSFSSYLIGYIIFVICLAVSAFYLNAPPFWIAIGTIILLGIGIMMATRREKPRDPPKV